MFGLDDAVLGWLVSSGGSEMVRRLRGDRAEAVLRRVVRDAVDATIAAAPDTLDAETARRVRKALLARRRDIGAARVTSHAELVAALARWNESLEDAGLGGIWPSAAVVAEELAANIVAGIQADARRAGPLAPLAEWLWRDDAAAVLSRIEYKIDRFPQPERPGAFLPGGTPDFTGRLAAITELARRFDAHDPRGAVVAISSVTGMAGVGKTALALHVAHMFKSRYPDGQFFVDLQGFTPAVSPMTALVALELLLDQAGIPGHSIPPDLTRRQARWRAHMAARSALIVLDNALDSEQITPLLPLASGCLVLVTSRNRISGPAGMRPLLLDVLAEEDARALFVRLVDDDRCADEAGVARLVQLVGRLPLAIEVLAGRLCADPTLTIAEMAVDLADTRRRLGETSAQYVGVRAAFGVSVDRLTADDRRSFQMLGLHPGSVIGVPQFAALAGGTGGDAARSLRQLTDRNLVKPMTSQVGHRRWEQHDLLRHYAREQTEAALSQADQEAALGRLISWYLEAMDLVGRRWYVDSTQTDNADHLGGLVLRGPADARGWLASEQGNLQALANVVTGSEVAVLGTRAARFLYLLDHYVSANALARRSARICREIGDRGGEARALRILGDLARATGDFAAAARYSLEAVDICRQIGQQLGEAQALQSLADARRLTGDLRTAGENFASSLSICQQIGERLTGAHGLRGLGDVAVATGEYSVARRHYELAVDIFHEVGEELGATHALRGLGDVACQTDDYDAAAEYYRTAYTRYQDLRDRYAEGRVLRDMGDLALILLAQATASDHFGRALTICREIGDRLGESHALRGLGDVAVAAGELGEAGERFGAAVELSVSLVDRVGLARARWGLGQIAKREGDVARARDQWQRALDLCDETGHAFGGRVRAGLASLDATQSA